MSTLPRYSIAPANLSNCSCMLNLVPLKVSHVDVVDIDEFCLHDLNDMVIQLGYGVVDLMYCHFLRSRLSLDYGLHPSIVDGDVLELEKYVKDNKIILVYVEHGSTNVETIFTTPRKGVVMEVDNQLRNDPIDVDSSPNKIKACSSRFRVDHVSLNTLYCHDILARAVQDQLPKNFDVGISRWKAFRAKRIATDKMTCSFKEQYVMLREYAQELIKSNPDTTVRIDVIKNQI
ncbi:hypothetical protein Tco_0016015 [Tanacetum coccineum]